MDEYNRMKRFFIKEEKRNRKRANRYRKKMGLPKTAIVILMPEYKKR